MIGFDPSLAGGTLLLDFLGTPIEVSPYLPKDTAYLLPATGDSRARFISDAHFDWSWQIFLWNQKDLARRHLARLVRDAEERLGLLPEPPPERRPPRILDEMAKIQVYRPEFVSEIDELESWAPRYWMPVINRPGSGLAGIRWRNR